MSDWIHFSHAHPIAGELITVRELIFNMAQYPGHTFGTTMQWRDVEVTFDCLPSEGWRVWLLWKYRNPKNE